MVAVNLPPLILQGRTRAGVRLWSDNQGDTPAMEQAGEEGEGKRKVSLNYKKKVTIL